MMISFCNLSLPQWSKIANNLIFNENFRWQTCKLLFRFNWGVFSSNNHDKADRQANQTRSDQPALCATPGWAKRKRPIGLQYPINELCRYTHTHIWLKIHIGITTPTRGISLSACATPDSTPNTTALGGWWLGLKEEHNEKEREREWVMGSGVVRDREGGRW